MVYIHHTCTKRGSVSKEQTKLEKETAMTMVKIDENLRKHQLCMVENESHAAGIVKRRRRSLDELQIKDPCQQVHANSFASTGVKRSSRFRGVSRHKLTGRYEAHLWDRLSWNITQRRKGKQVYLGAYDKEELAARAYDLAALKYWGTTTQTNFPVSDYKDEIEIMESLTKEEYLATLRRKSSGFARGVSKYRGVARHHQNGRWEARIGRVFGNKYLYLGTYSSQEEAARAYDIAAVEYRGINAVTNFDLSDYIRWLKPGAESLVLPQEQERSAESQQKTFSSNFIKESESSILPNKTYDNLNREEYQTNSRAGSFRRSSSSTALSLLLRSSRFKELVEKNSSVGDDGTDGDEDEKDLFTASDDYEDRRILHGGIGRIPYVFEFDDDCLELKKDLLTTLRRELLAE